MAVASAPVRLRRPGRERSKYGCLTCKIRRVKCDQTAPRCRKCLDTGRTCEGPQIKQIRFAAELLARPTHPVVLPEISLLAPQRSDDERWAFNYFLHRAAPLFAGVVDAPFWLDLVPRLAQSHSFIWDVVISCSWMFEHVRFDQLKTTHDADEARAINDTEHRKALKWYSRAVASFRLLLEQGEADNGYILLSCILFAAFEFQQRHIGNAWRLIDSAFAILDQNLGTSKTPGAVLNSPTLYELVTAFISRKTVLMGRGKPIQISWNTHTEETPLRPSMKLYLNVLMNAKTQLDGLMYQAYEVIRVGHLLYNDDSEMQKLIPKQQHMLRVVKGWKDHFLQLCKNEPESEVRCFMSILLMYWSMCFIWLSTCTSSLQTSFDDNIPIFAAILTHAQVIIERSASSTSATQQFKYEGDSVTPPLLFTATKCRDPILRRRALQLIRQTPQRDVWWSSVAAPSLIEKIIAVEEGDEHFSDEPDYGQASCLPPEEQRIHHHAILKATVTDGRRHVRVQLTKAAFDADGTMRMVHEEVYVEDHIRSSTLISAT